ncbi:MAG: UDPGP type 1 family protein, partial [Planctomycetes bacterium]|nr:UDPGP type 1 family protein [Planctomycetota bacterium]
SDLPEELARQKDDLGRRKFDAGSIAIHVLSRPFVERITADETNFGLPWHRALKKVAYMDETGRRIEPDHPNAVKLEAFIFDAIPMAKNPLVLQTLRAEEFSPVKNATGVDSADTARRDMNRRVASWLGSAGFDVPLTPAGEPDGQFEISPLLALDAGHLREVMLTAPVIRRSEAHYWE